MARAQTPLTALGPPAEAAETPGRLTAELGAGRAVRARAGAAPDQSTRLPASPKVGAPRVSLYR